MAVRTMLFSGCCAVSVEPAVCVWKRSIHDRGFFAPKRSRMMRAHRRRAQRNLATSSRKLLWALKKKDRRGAKRSMSRPASSAACDVGDAVGEGEGDLLRGGRAGLAHVVAGDGDGVPLGHLVVGPGEHVGDDAHGVRDRIDVGPARDVLLEDVVLHGAGELLHVGSGAARNGNVERKQNARRRVDGHRGGDFVERNAVEEALHVLDGVDGHADLADFAERHRVVGVVADLRGQIEGHRESRGSVGEEEFVAAIGLFCVAHAGVLAHGPEASAIHGGLDAAREGVFAGIAEVAVGVEADGVRGRRRCRRVWVYPQASRRYCDFAALPPSLALGKTS